MCIFASLEGKMLLSPIAKAVIVVSLTLAGCSRHRQQAVLLSNEADKAVEVDPEAAIEKYQQATQLDPNNHRIFFKLAQAYRKQENWEKVASTLGQAVGKAPTFANYWFWRGYALEQQARTKSADFAAAREPYEKCIEADPNYAQCYHQLGWVHLYLDDEQKALEFFTKAIERNPAGENNLDYFAALADLYMRLGYVKEGEATLREAKKFARAGDRKLYGIHVLLSQALQEDNRLADIVTELEAAKAVAGTEGSEAVTILYSLGSTYAKLKPPRKAEALQMLKAFSARACKGKSAERYKADCEISATLVTKLGGSSAL